MSRWLQALPFSLGEASQNGEGALPRRVLSADFRENGTTNDGLVDEFGDYTWWLIPVSKWIITPVISELTLLSPVITRGITYLLSGGEPPSNNNDKLMIRL